MGGTSVCGSGFCLPESPGPCFDIWSQIYWPKHMTQWWVLCHQQVRMAGTIGNIPKSLWGKSICPSLSYLLLGQHSWQVNNWSKKEHYEISIFTHLFQKHFSDIKCWFKFTKNSTIFLLIRFDKKSAVIRAMVFCLSGNNPSPEARETQFVPASIISSLGPPVCWHWFLCSSCCGRAHLGHSGSVLPEWPTGNSARGVNPCLLALLSYGIICLYVGKNWKMNERTLKHSNCQFTHTLCILIVATNMLGRSNYH